MSDGTAAGLRQPDARGRSRLLRRGTRLPGAAPRMGGGETPRGHPPGDLADAHPGADGVGRRCEAGAAARPASGPGLARRTVDPRSLELALRGGRTRPGADYELLRRDG